MKQLSRFLVLLLAFVMTVSLAACGNNDEDDSSPSDVSSGDDVDEDEEINPSMTQLYALSCGAGYGSAWLVKAKKRYEALHKNDTQWEEGKKGVQIIIEEAPNYDVIKNDIKNGTSEVLFNENATYFQMINELESIGDITEAVTTPIDGDNGKTIESKMTQQQKDFYCVDGRYYGFPHYAAYAGFNYDIDLFEEKGYYLLATPTADTLDGRFIGHGDKNAKKSTGPDGQFGTFDDGLPATYDDFFALCDFIVENDQIPVTWAGNVYNDYCGYVYRTMAVDCDGLEQSLLNFTYNGQATTLGHVNDDNEWVADAEPTVITDQNGYELARQEGKYQTLKFWERLLRTDSYHHPENFNKAYDHMMVKDDFLMAREDGTTKEAAMLIEGNWWLNECKDIFKDMVDNYGEQYSQYNRRFGFLPSPKPYQEKVGQKPVLYDHLNSLCCMKSTIAEWKKPLAYDFLKFCSSDESLIEFTVTTNCPKALNYEMPQAALDQLAPYGKQLMLLKENADIVYPFSNAPVFVNNIKALRDPYFRSVVAEDGTEVNEQYASKPLHTFGDITVKQYFDGMYTRFQTEWGKLVI